MPTPRALTRPRRPAKPGQADELAALLTSDAAEQRAQAYAVLEATEDAAVALAAVVPMMTVLARPVEEVDAAELRRAGLALGRMVCLDCVVVGGECYKMETMKKLYSSEDNALNAALRKPVNELSRADALLCAAMQSYHGTSGAKGLDPVLTVAGKTAMEHIGEWTATSPFQGVLATDERNCRLSTLLVEALREEREQMAEGLVAAAWMFISELSGGIRSVVAQHQIELGCLALAVAELRTIHSSEWVSVCRDTLRAQAAMTALGMILASIPDPGTPGLLDVGLDALAAYERADALGEKNVMVVYFAAVVLLNGRLYWQSDANAARIRGATTSIRFLLDNPLFIVENLGWSTGMMAGILAAEVFGRDEGDTMELRQAHVDDLVKCMTEHMTGGTTGGVQPLIGWWSTCMLNLCVSDYHKTLLLHNQEMVPHLLSGLFLDPDHPRGLKTREILGPQSVPTPLEVQGIFQQNYAEALAQLALFPAGKDVLLEHESAIAALEQLVESGMSAEAKEFARGALISLRGFAEHEKAVAEHVMLSYLFRAILV